MILQHVSSLYIHTYTSAYMYMYNIMLICYGVGSVSVGLILRVEECISGT